MKFYGVGVVWNKVSNSVLCKFRDGEFEAKDIGTITRLKKLGYKYDKIIEDIPTELVETEPVDNYKAVKKKSIKKEVHK